MKRIIVLGQTNAGKTLFTLNFAAYLGADSVTITFQNQKDGVFKRTLLITEAIDLLVSRLEHFTRDIQSTTLSLPWGKGNRNFELLDTAGLTDGIHENIQIRTAMAQTLAMVRKADIILHILDCDKIATVDILRSIGEVDYQVAQFGQLRDGYVILANKMDLPGSSAGLAKIKAEFPGNRVIAISALEKRGFREVKDYVRRLL